jgi:hypothetical protein
MFDRTLQEEQRANRDLRDSWDRYQPHRDRVTAEILALVGPETSGRLCLLGAGNASDVDLEELATRFQEIHLVDIDAAAVAHARDRQPPALRARLHLHAPVDLSGLCHQIDPPLTLRPTDALVTMGTAEVVRQVPSGFDVVASCCLLSRMSRSLDQTTEPLPALRQMLREVLARIHLRSMLGVIRPSGAALLLADLVCSRWRFRPADEVLPGEDLRAAIRRLLPDRLDAAVCNPEFLRGVLQRDPELARACYPSRLGEPWLWPARDDHGALVYPLVLRRYPRGVRQRE